MYFDKIFLNRDDRLLILDKNLVRGIILQIYRILLKRLENNN